MFRPNHARKTLTLCHLGLAVWFLSAWTRQEIQRSLCMAVNYVLILLVKIIACYTLTFLPITVENCLKMLDTLSWTSLNMGSINMQCNFTLVNACRWIEHKECFGMIASLVWTYLLNLQNLFHCYYPDKYILQYTAKTFCENTSWAIFLTKKQVF